MTQPLFHVLLNGRQVGPFDARTIIGMRVRQVLSSSDRLLGPGGEALTVRDLLEKRHASQSRKTWRSSTFSTVLASYMARSISSHGRGIPVPPFRGEVEARIQGDVLRLAGRFRRYLRWRHGRIKLPLAEVTHARLVGCRVDLWLGRVAGAEFQRVSLEMGSVEEAGELVEWLPQARPWPESAGEPYRDDRSSWPFAGWRSALLLVAAGSAGWLVWAGHAWR